MATITMNPKKMKPGEVRISPGKPKKTARQKANQAADALGGAAGMAVTAIRKRGFGGGIKHNKD